MASYVFFYLAGMYPLPATRQILLSSPYFPVLSIHNPFLNTTTTIKSNNFTGNPVDGVNGNIYVKVGDPALSQERCLTCLHNHLLERDT